MNWNVVHLSDLCTVRIGRTPRRDTQEYWGGNAVWVTIRELDGGIITDSKEHISDLAVREVMPPPIPAGTLLFSFKLSIGKMGIAGVPLYTNEAIASLEIKPDALVTPEFLRYALTACSSEAGANHAVLGKVLNKAKVEALPIPLPPLGEQQRIVDILSRAEGIVRLRREAQQKAAEIIPALFLDMFGDPATNPKGWQVLPLSELTIDVKNGFNPTKEQFVPGIKFVTVNSLYNGMRIDIEAAQEVSADRKTIEKYLLEKGDICFVRSSVKRSGVGVSSVYDSDTEAIFGGFVIRIKLCPKINPFFLAAQLQTAGLRNQIIENAGTGTITNINQPSLLRLPIIVPPIDLQLGFIKLAEQASSIVQQQQRALITAQATFNALLAQSFAPPTAQQAAALC